MEGSATFTTIQSYFHDRRRKAMTESSKQDHESYFTVLVRQMREAQKNYFRTRSYESLKQSKELESQVDSVLAGEPQQGKLF